MTRLRDAALEAMRAESPDVIDVTQQPVHDAATADAARAAMAAKEEAAMRAVRAAQTQAASPQASPPRVAPWSPPPVELGPLNPSVVASRFEAELASLGGAGTDEREVVERFAQLLGFSVRGVMAMHAADPKAAATMTFVLQFAADTLTRRGDGDGAALLTCLLSLLSGVRPGAVDALPPSMVACFDVAVQRAAARGWTLVRPEERDRRPAPPNDPDEALKDAFAYALLVFWSRLQWQNAAQA